MASGNFAACLTHVLRQEGGYVDHPSDPGGATNRGITRKTLARWRGISPWWKLAKSEVKALTEKEAATIYRGLYWNRCAGTSLPAGVDLAVFDFAVNSGPARAIRHLQATLRVKTDGIVGPLTLKAVRDFERQGRTALVVRTLCANRLGFLKRLSTFAVFGKGWRARVETVQTAALAMCPPEQSISTPTKRRPAMDFLSGYKTYIVGVLMMLAAIAQMAGFAIPGFEADSAAQLLMEGFAIVFLRKGLTSEIDNA